MKTRIILVRHAEAEGNYVREFHGFTDGDITEKGHKQAKKAAESLKDTPIDILYSSSLKRTLQTAQYIADIKNLPIIRTDKMKEINGGDWERQRWDVLPVKWPEEYENWEKRPHLTKCPNGESMVEFQKRLIEEVEHIIAQNKGKNICIVTHGTALRALMCYFMACPLEEMINTPWYDNTAITVMDYEDGKFNILRAGDSSHLGKELSTLENQDWWEEYMKNLKERK